MRPHLSIRLLLGVCLLAGAASHAVAQGKPGGPPQVGPPPGGPPLSGPPPGARGPGGPPNAPASGSGSNGSGSTQHPGTQFGPVGRWWDDRSVVQRVGISHDQQRKMDTIFEANKPAILSTYKTFLSEKSKLDALGKQSNVDQASMFAAIDAVNQARAALQKANTQMLLQIRQQMQPDQITKLESLQ
jgi:Spy/CpxP family protein refolding chaperone